MAVGTETAPRLTCNATLLAHLAQTLYTPTALASLSCAVDGLSLGDVSLGDGR